MVAESLFEVYSTESHLWNMSGPDTTEHYWALQRTHQMSAWAIFRGGADTAAGLSGLVSGPGIIHYPPRCDCMPLSLLWSWLDKVSQY